jgi:hypothetical protein
MNKDLHFFLICLLILIGIRNSNAQTCSCAEKGPNLIVNGDFEDPNLLNSPVTGVTYNFTWLSAIIL